jgi:transposase
MRHGSDLTDAEWAIVALLKPRPAKTGRPCVWSMREIMSAILFAAGGLRLSHAAQRFSAGTVFGWFLRFRREACSKPPTIISSCAIAGGSGARPAPRRL